MLHHLFKGQFHYFRIQMAGSSIFFLKEYYHKNIQLYLVLLLHIDIFLKAGQSASFCKQKHTFVF